MRPSFAALIFVCFVFIIAGLGQNRSAIDESQIRATLENRDLHIELPVSNWMKASTVRIRLEVLDPLDKVLAFSEKGHPLRRGDQVVKMVLECGTNVDTDLMLWNRVRYSVWIDGTPTVVSDIVALSEIMPELFELKVTAPEFVYAGMNARTHVLAIHPYSKEPIRNVSIVGTVGLELDTDEDEDELKIVAVGKTNAEGFATLDFRIPEAAKLGWGGDIEIEGKKGGIVRKIDEDLEVSKGSRVYLQTDKPLYQPGQKLSVRGMYLDPRRRPLAGREIEFTILDEDEDEVHSGELSTSRFGITNLDWQLPANIKLGKYKIEVETDDGDIIGTAEFKISRYDIPNFTVNAKADRYYYLPNQPIATVSVSADYLFGKRVANGTVRIVREKSREWNFLDQKYETEIQGEYEGETNGDGVYTLSVDLSHEHAAAKSDQWQRFHDVKFVAYFTDITTNRTEQRRFDLRITKEPIHVYLARYEMDLSPDLPVQYYVSTFYADGTPAKCDVTIGGHYENAVTSETIGRGRTNSHGAAKMEIRIPKKPFPEAKDRFNFFISAVDKDGNRGGFAENFRINERERQLFLDTDKTIYGPEQPIFVRLLSKSENETVFIDVLKDSSVIYSKRLTVKDGEAKFQIPYRPDFQGELSISANLFTESRYEQTSGFTKTVIYPTQNGIKLDIRSLNNTYRPGENAKIGFNVKDGRGLGLESALGIVVLDTAIEERARTEQLPDNLADMRQLLGTSEMFGDISRRDLDKIDTARPVPAEMQLAADFLLIRKHYRPNTYVSESFREDFGDKYEKTSWMKLGPVVEALRSHYEKTQEFASNDTSLALILKAYEIDLDQFRDAWNRPYRIAFRTDRANSFIEFHSSSADKIQATNDDFKVGEIRFEWFARVRTQLDNIFLAHLQNADKPPANVDELKAMWKAAGVDFDVLRDGAGRPLQVTAREYKRDAVKNYLETVAQFDGERQQVMRSTPVAQRVVLFRIVSVGRDGTAGNSDDFDLAVLTSVLEENDLSRSDGGTSVSKTAIDAMRGAIAGRVVDQNGAVIPGADVFVRYSGTSDGFNLKTNDIGEFLISNVPSDKYDIRVESPGFKRFVMQNVVVSSMNLIRVDIVLEVGEVNAMVEVSSSGELMANQSYSQVSNSSRRVESSALSNLRGSSANQAFTPRVREYFPETLLWQPELITDKRGRALLEFKLADSLTTWKLYAFATTESGEAGFVEREIKTFQPFFAELDPPRILTEGDEISLPIPLRNYTDKTQRVSVSIELNAWSSILNQSSQQVLVSPDSTQNAVFTFRANAVVRDGKQRVTARAESEGDAVEKVVTVLPNGREMVDVQTSTFTNTATFGVDFPDGALPGNRTAELKIYPNLLAHVAESSEGLLKRPYGCGEQTTSSTYPNLLMLKLEKEFGTPLNKDLKSKAEAYLGEGYTRLLNYQTPSGGFSYWGRNDTPNVALTAYILRFLNDAKEFIDVDETFIERASDWLIKQQQADGSWSAGNAGNDSSTAYVLRSLLHIKDNSNMKAISDAYTFLRTRSSQTNDAYVLSNFVSTAVVMKDKEAAFAGAQKLIGLMQTGKDGTYWNGSSTPFYGWGKTAEIETTALAVKAINDLKTLGDTSTGHKFENAAGGGVAFILKNKDQFGVWYSTQTTVTVLDTLIDIQRRSTDQTESLAQNISVSVNGSVVTDLSIDRATFNTPITIEIGRYLDKDKNRVEIKGQNTKTTSMANLVSTYYVDWSSASGESKHFDLNVAFSKTESAIGEQIEASVELARKGRTTNGMVLAEIGTPPGAEVDRGSLDQAKASGAVSRYDVLPDRVVIYSWVSKQPIRFGFKFRPRYGINAQTPASVVYDYYNPEAQAVNAPIRFVVK